MGIKKFLSSNFKRWHFHENVTQHSSKFSSDIHLNIKESNALQCVLRKTGTFLMENCCTKGQREKQQFYSKCTYNNVFQKKWTCFILCNTLKCRLMKSVQRKFETNANFDVTLLLPLWEKVIMGTNLQPFQKLISY